MTLDRIARQIGRAAVMVATIAAFFWVLEVLLRGAE
jgi:hypothetical protein